jgi:hypothetical protein
MKRIAALNLQGRTCPICATAVALARELKQHVRKCRRRRKKKVSQKARAEKAAQAARVAATSMRYEERRSDGERYGGWREVLEESHSEDERCGGFSGAEHFELACQGVKPWEDDAGAVMAALSGNYDYY